MHVKKHKRGHVFCIFRLVLTVSSLVMSLVVYRFFDTSKQAVGAMLVHFANIFLAGLFKGDPCTW